MSEHKADIERIPAVLQSLSWEERKGHELFYDKDRVIAAVPVVGTGDKRCYGKTISWHYELAVVTIECDEHYFEVTLDGDPWGWGWSDVDFFVRLDGGAKERG